MLWVAWEDFPLGAVTGGEVALLPNVHYSLQASSTGVQAQYDEEEQRQGPGGLS